MAGAYRVLRVPLSEHIQQLKRDAEETDFGYTHQSLVDEAQHQIAIEEKLEMIGSSVAGADHRIQRELDNIAGTVDVNRQCLHYLSGITDLEDFYSDLTTINVKRVLRLVSQKMNFRFWKRKLSSKVRRAWQNIGRYSELVTVHLKNAADFHQFYYDARQVEIKLNERCHKFQAAQSRYNWENCDGTVVEARELTNLLRDQCEHLEYLTKRSKEILERSNQVVPIHLRVNRLKGPVEGVMLCDYETPNFKLCAGDSVLVLSNSASLPGEQSQTSESQTESRSELSGTQHTSETTSEEINDLATEVSDGMHPGPAVRRPPIPFRWEKREYQGSSTETGTHTSSSYLTESSLQSLSSNKLQWHVRTPNGEIDALVPAVCVWIPAPDIEARDRSIALNRILLDTWKDIIDNQLIICLQFFKALLRRILQSDGITTDDNEAFKRFLHELTYSLSEPPSAEEDETRNKEFLELINLTKQLWENTDRDAARRDANVIHLKRSEISNFHCVLVWIKIHMQKNREYELELSTDYQIGKKHLEELRSASYRVTETITVLNPPIIVQLRQRTIQYELLESRKRSAEDEWNNIREVASPQTGHFAPVAMAIRFGWIRLGQENVYVDPETNISIPLSQAYEMGRIRLSSPYAARRSQPSEPILLLIERVYHVWRKTQLVNVVDTARGLAMTPEAALQAGILETTEDEIRYLDTLNNTWITIEEGVGRQIIQTDEVDSLSDSISEDNDEPAMCRVFRLTQLCPGGEPSPWMCPIEANRLGLFRWETGDVAADWPARPQLRYEDLMGTRPPEAFVPTKWCSFLTAKHAGWLRLTEEEDPSRWITTATSHLQEKNSVLLSTQIKLLAHTSSPIHSYGNQVEIGATHQMPESTDAYSSGDTDLRYMYYPRQLPNSGRMISTHRVRAYEHDEQSYHEETSDNLYSESLSERQMFDSSQEPYYHTDVYDSS